MILTVSGFFDSLTGKSQWAFSGQRVKKLFFDALTGFQKGRKTSNSHSSAYMGTVE